LENHFVSIFGGKKPAAQKDTHALGLDFQSAQYGNCIPVVFGQNKLAGNVIDYMDFLPVAHKQKAQGGKGGHPPSTTSWTYQASFVIGLCEGLGTIVTVYNGTGENTLAGAGGIGFNGSATQGVWAHLTGTHALNYSATSIACFQDMQLGDTASLPNLNFEIAGRNQLGGGIVDANAADILTAICTDTQIGVKFTALGDLTAFRNYSTAAGLFFSPVYDTQAPASQAIESLLKYANSAGYFSEGVLKVVPYGDSAITANGATYTPNLTVVADLGANDFMTNGPGPKVTTKRKSPADALNIVHVEYKDRSAKYRTIPVTASIDQDVVATGSRTDQSESVDMITLASTARLVAQNLLQRMYYIRNTYSFRLAWRWCWLEPTDIVSLTDVGQGLNLTPVRITSISEDEHGLLSVEAEELPDGIGHGGTYATPAVIPTNTDPDVDPGPVTAPYFFRAPGFLVSAGAPEIWVAVNGANPMWGGCDVYLSQNGSSYTYLSTFARKSIYGSLTNTLPNVADPDTTSAPNVSLYAGGVLLGGLAADADEFVTMAMVDTEIISYQAATLAAGPSYTLGTRIRRGGYGTTIASHSAGAPFVRLDENILRIPMDASQVGSVIYVKFLSFNAFGRGDRTLAMETAYPYTVGSNIEFPDVPATPGSFAVTGVADGINLTWNNVNPAAVACTSIERCATSGGTYTVIAQVGPTDTMYHDAMTTGATWFYKIRSRGHQVSGGWSAYTAFASGTAYNTTTSVAAALAAANAAQADATAALAQLTDIASDSLLTPGEKPIVIKDRDALTAEQAGIDAQATAFSITTEKTTYDTAVTALTTYLATLTSPVLWSNLGGNTTIVGTTFRQKFLDVYAARTALLNKIYAAAKLLADTAQAAANAAQADATSALATLTDIASDSLLTPGEKPIVIKDRDTLTGEQSGIDAQATTYSVTTEKTTYDTAVTALTTYLATLTSPVLWSNLGGSTTIVGTTFRQKFLDVYAARTVLLQKIADVVTYGNTAGNGTNVLWDEYSRYLTSTLPTINLNVSTAAAVSDSLATGGFALQLTTASATNAEYCVFGSSPIANFNLPLPPGKYIVSAYMRASVSGHLVRFVIKDDGNTGHFGANLAITNTTGFVRYSQVIDTTAAPGANQLLYINTNMSAVSGRVVTLDRIMIEPQVGGLTTPSPYVQGNPARLAINAQTAANAAQADATSALATLTNIASDSLLTPGEKPVVIKDRDAITAEQSGIDSQATGYGITTEKTTYDTAVTALTTYLATLTTPVLWSTLSGDTTIVGTTFRQKFLDVYAARQVLLQKIADTVTLGNTGGNGINMMWDEQSRFTALPQYANYNDTLTTFAYDAATTIVGDGGSFQVTSGAANANGFFQLNGSSGDYNIPCPGGQKYILSFYARCSTAGHTIRPQYTRDDAVSFNSAPDFTLTTANTWYRVALVVDLSAVAAIRKIAVGVFYNRAAVTGRVTKYAGFMLEPIIGQLTTPSPWVLGTAGRLALTGITNAASAQAAAVAAQADATSALATLTDIASDSLLTPGEKPVVIKDRDSITNEQSGIDSAADLYQVVTEKTTYDTAVTALTTYLATLTTPVLWSTLSGNTTIVGTTFRQKFTDVYSARQALLNKIASNAQGLIYAPRSGSEQLVNADFEFGTDSPPVGWALNSATVLYDTTTQFAGTRSIKVTSTATNGGILSDQKYGISVGGRIRVSGQAKRVSGTGSASIAVSFFDNTGAVVSTVNAGTTTSSSWTALTGVCQAPANTSYYQVNLRCTVSGDVCEFDNILLGRQRDLDNDIEDGATMGRVLLTDLSSNRVGLRVAGSGHRIGDQRNLPQITITNLQSKVPTVVTYTSTATTATISVAAFTVTAGSVTVSYSASSVGTTGSGTVTYYLYMDDPTYAGGTQTLVATTTALVCYQNDGRLLVGVCTVIYTAGGSGGGGSGGHDCVAASMFLRFGHRAGDAQQLQMIDCIDLPAGLPIHARAIEAIKQSVEDCVLLRTAGGAEWEGSTTTPFDLVGGGSKLAPDMMDEIVITDRGPERVILVWPTGRQLVVRISVGGVSYAAGRNPLHRVFSHNTIKP
jgi:hypothetical protein